MIDVVPDQDPKFDDEAMNWHTISICSENVKLIQNSESTFE